MSIGSDLSTAKPMVGHRFISLVDVSRCAYEYLFIILLKCIISSLLCVSASNQICDTVQNVE